MRMTVQRDIDRMVEWYKLNKPSVTRLVVNARPETIYKFAGKPMHGASIQYRGFEIICGKLAEHVKRMDGTTDHHALEREADKI